MTLNLPEFSSNVGSGDERRTVAADISSALLELTSSGKLSNAPALDVASAYFNAMGYELIADALDEVGTVRLLLGAEPTDAQLRATVTPLTVRAAHKGDPRVDAAIAHHEQALTEDRDLAGFGHDADALVERLIEWLERDDIEVRRLERGFLHGKAYILDAAGHSALAGSSNLTFAGLSQNRELNVGVYQPNVVSAVREWFDEQWEAAVPYDLAALYRARRVPHDPWLVFLRMLQELYLDDLENDRNTDNELGLADYQIDGVWRAKRILHKRNGVIIADEVGLGKTFIAGELIREATLERRQKVLIVAPATLRDSTWNPFLNAWNLKATVVSFEELVNELDENSSSVKKLLSVGDYAMVVVDEAHHIRNAGTHRAAAMRKVLSGTAPKDLVLLSATPVNNSLLDLYNLLGYMSPSDAAFSDIGVPSLSEYFRRAMAMDPDELSGEHLFEVLDAVAVRRTRRFIKTQYPHASTGDGKPIVFPQAVVHRVDYDLSDVLPDFFPRFAAALGTGLDDETPPVDGTFLTMARYVPSRYDSKAGEYQYQIQNAGLLQSALLKRFESSSAAFCSTLRTMMASHDQFLAALDKGWVLTGDALKRWLATDTDDLDEFVSALDDDARDNAESATEYDVAKLRHDVESDRALLAAFESEVSTVEWRDDPKIAALVEELATIAADARTDGVGEQQTRDKRKVLLFTYFADTAAYVKGALDVLCQEDPRLADFADRLVLVSGHDKSRRQESIVGFTPRTAGHVVNGVPLNEDKYDLAVATDVLSEGVNLQQAGHIINYDLPWNPMRLVQRHGRVDRIGSEHAHIHLRCFFPDAELEDLLALEARLQLKLKHAAAAFGTDEVLPGMKPVERVIAENKDEIEKLRAENASLFDDTRGASASSEEFQRRLAVAMSSESVKQAVNQLPWGAGTGLVKAGTDTGVVFCVKVADHPRPFFRFVPMAPDGAELSPRLLEDGTYEVSDQMLTCLNLADPGTPPLSADLPPEMHQAAFDAWPVAQDSVFRHWMDQTDPAKVQPKVPKAMHRAAAMVRSHGAFLGAEQDRLAERFGQHVEARILTMVREALAIGDSDPSAAVRALKAVANDVRLPVPEVVAPKPEIELDDVRVLCWVAVRPGAVTTGMHEG